MPWGKRKLTARHRQRGNAQAAVRFYATNATDGSVIAARSLRTILPRESGEGGPRVARWKGRGPRRSTCDENEALTQTPPPPHFVWSPSPAIAGRTSFLVLAMRCASELCCTHKESFKTFAVRADLRQRMPAVVTGSLTICASSHKCKRRKKRKAERRKTLIRILRTLRCGSRLAARSPAGVPPRFLPEGRQSPRLSFRPGFLGRGFNGRYPLSPVPVQWQHPTHRS